MKKILILATLIVASQFAFANGLTKTDSAAMWLQAPAQEQAALASALGEAVGVSKKSDLRHLILCMRDLAVELKGRNPSIDDLFKGCLPGVKKSDGVPLAEQVPGSVTTAALEKAKLLHERVKEKDAEAMYTLAMLIESSAPKGQVEYDASEWPKYGGRYVFGRQALLMEAASLDNKKAAAYLCKVASDPGAPARYRGNKEKWCSVQAQ
jgi:hypothetical protein